MLQGWLDELKTSGHVEGWAVDTAAPGRTLCVGILDRHDQEIGHGLAHAYREDLAAAGIGTGWCAFRIRVDTSPLRLRHAPLTLVERSTGIRLHHADPMRFGEDHDQTITTIGALIDADPTIIADISQLQGCEPVFSAFIKARGVNAFIRAAYVYVLGRPVDQAGLARYGGLIRKGSLMAVELLAILADSDEFRAKPRTLAAPNTASFPFQSG